MARECHCMTQPNCETYSVAKPGVFIFSANTEYTVPPSLIESGDCDREGASYKFNLRLQLGAEQRGQRVPFPTISIFSKTLTAAVISFQFHLFIC